MLKLQHFKESTGESPVFFETGGRMEQGKKRVAILVQNLHNGGAERMAANLSIELAKYYE